MRGQPEGSADGRHRCHGHVPLLPVTAAVARTNGPNSGHVFHVATAPQQLSNKPEKLRAAATRTGAKQCLLQAKEAGAGSSQRDSPLIIVFVQC